MKKPKTLYEFNVHYEIEIHKLKAECFPQFLRRIGLKGGGRWRCRHPETDFYGYDMRYLAKEDAIDRIRNHVGHLRTLLEKMEGK